MAAKPIAKLVSMGVLSEQDLAQLIDAAHADAGQPSAAQSEPRAVCETAWAGKGRERHAGWCEEVSV